MCFDKVNNLLSVKKKVISLPEMLFTFFKFKFKRYLHFSQLHCCFYNTQYILELSISVDVD